MKTITTIFFFITFIFYSKCQNITGNAKIQSDSISSLWAFVTMSGIETRVDSVGDFELNNINVSDTLRIIPFFDYIIVSICNFPDSLDSIHFDSIPIFSNLSRGIPIISFTSKRASRKFWKNFKKKRELEKMDLIKEINNYRFHWNNKDYRLNVIDQIQSLSILIDLDQ